jgi:phosphoglycerol transferase MdoB-like AlkP superfamily enzyme
MNHNATFLPVLYAFFYGFRLDLSMSSFLTILPFLLIQIERLLPVNLNKWTSTVLKIYILLASFAVLIIATADAFLYSYWGQKLTSYAASFAKFPGDALAYTPTLTVVAGVLVPLLLGVAIVFVVNRWHATQRIKYNSFSVPDALSILLVSGILFLFIRGGWGKSTINPSSAYYSSVQVNNHLSVNSAWYFLSTVLDDFSSTANPYEKMTDIEATKLVSTYLNASMTDTAIQLCGTESPNIMLIILEGWTANVVGCISNRKGITPELDKLAAEGLLFTRCYANGNRTDKGLAAILCSEPSLARQSIVNHIDKFTNLNSIPAALQHKGYTTSFYYGGDVEFANMKAFLMNIGMQNVKDQSSIRATDNKASWGLHDDAVYAHTLSELKNVLPPFFTTILTLSSHDPFDVPFKGSYYSDNYSSRYLNAVQYADHMLGKFIEQFKQSPLYKNTLVCIVSDHGHTLPDNLDAADPKAFHIPLVFAGGALQNTWKGKRINRICNQTDIVSILPGQINQKSQSFFWSRHVLDTTITGSAIFRYNDGTGLVNEKGVYVWDNSREAFIHKPKQTKKESDYETQRQIQAIQQVQYRNYLNR